MKRVLRKTTRVEIIISDSEDESTSGSSDDNYVPELEIAKANKKRKEQVTNDGNANSRKRRVNALLPETKKRKVAEPETKPLVTDTVSTAVKKSEDSEKELKGTNLKNKKEKAQNVSKENDKDASRNVHQLHFNFDSVQCRDWTDVDYVAEANSVDKRIAENVVRLFNEDNTIPFIARYRKNMTGGMEPDVLRALKESFDHAKVIKQRAATILKTIDKLGQWTPHVHAAITSTKCMDDLEHIYSFFKPASRRTLAERAKELGLAPVSDTIIKGQRLPDLSSLIDPRKDGLKTEQQIKDGIIHIIADIINKDKAMFDKVKELQSESIIKIQTTECKANKSSSSKEKDASRKYETYYDFNANTRSIRPHQILAINRAEAQKILNVKITLPDFLERAYKSCCAKQYEVPMTASKFHTTILNDSIDYAYSKFIKPLIVRRIRNEMKQKAETASIEVFVTNVKQLLLTPPARGKIILGIDPGFTHGCKLGVISEHGKVLETDVIYPHRKAEKSYDESANILKGLVKRHKCTILALGNATACRETETFLSRLIKSKAFGSMDISYTIVDEAGASIYSCSTEAKSEFPDLDANAISAISIARRLQDPLAELVKVEPKHLGVGMYQHDLPEKQLSVALNEVVSEAVSFVGVDVNTASQCLLKRVAGLNVSRASSIIEWRTEHGPFKNRQQLLKVKGIGNKTFEQCAGFIRILPETSTTDGPVKIENTKNSKGARNLLDQTWIHPESYKIAERFLSYCNCSLEDLGTATFIDRIQSFAKEGCETLARKFDTDETTMEVTVKGLSMKKDEDIRLKANHPLFRNSMLSINDISPGTVLTGAIRNITHFGVFVDVGVGRDGLVPTKWMRNYTVSIGQRVEVKVHSVEIDRKRISLELTNVL